MADDIEKFVLQYIVETKDSIGKLETLLDKMNSVEQKSPKSSAAFGQISKGLSSLATEAGGAGEAIAGLGVAMSGLSAVAAPIAIAIAGMLALKEVISGTRDVMKELNEQRDLGAKTGMSALSVENITRNVTRAPGSQVDRAGAEDIISTVSEKLRSAYADPTQTNRDALLLRQSGVSINGPEGGINDSKTALAQLSESFKNMTQEQARGMAQLYGLTQQQADAMHNLGAKIVDTTHMTEQEAEARQNALIKTQEVAAATNILSEHWRELKDDILVHVVPAIDVVVKSLAEAADWAEKFGGKIINFIRNRNQHKDRDRQDLLSGNFSDFFKHMGEEWNTSAKTIGKSAKEQMESADKSNAASMKYTSDMERLINLFGQSVTQFSNSIDEREAWAAWAGEIGRASGLSTSGNKSLGFTGTGGNTTQFSQSAANASVTGTASSARDSHTFDSLYLKAAAATGLPAEFIKRVSMAESDQNPNAVSKLKNGLPGAVGLMQIIPSNFKSLGITDAHNPEQNIMGGAKLLAQLYKQFGNYDDALRAYNGGQDKENWNNPETANYVNRVMSQKATINGGQEPIGGGGMMSGSMKYAWDPKAPPQFTFSGGNLIDLSKGGASREKMAFGNIQRLLAQQIGVPVEALQTGSVTAGDEKYAASNMFASLLNSRATLNAQLSTPGLPGFTYGALQKQLVTTDRQLQDMMRYMPQIQSQAAPGDRNLTLGAGAVQVIVQGANVSPQQLADEINKNIGYHLHEAVNGMSDGISH